MSTIAEIKQTAREFWAYLSGKKRNIACAWWGLVIPMYGYLQEMHVAVPHWAVIVVALVGLVLTYLGLGHAAIKAKTASDATSITE